jgi:membrane protein implicated in regulation of membrane protease activity
VTLTKGCPFFRRNSPVSQPVRLALCVMNIQAPPKYSQRWWVLIACATAVFATVTAVSLDLIGFEFDIYFILFVLLVSGVSDLFLATSMEAVSPTKITIGPGEKARHDSELNETAVVISGFEESAIGRVSVRGEAWNAKYGSGPPESLRPGTEVSILERDGLTLIVGGLTRDT